LEELAEKNAELVSKVAEFVDNKRTDEDNLTLEAAKRILTLQIEIKDLNDDIAEVKKEAKNEGIAVGKVMKALKKLKDLAKANDMDLLEIETIEKVLESDVDIKTMINELVKKD